MSPDLAIKTWITDFGETGWPLRHSPGKESPVQRTTSRVSPDVAVEIFFAEQPIRTYFSQFANFHMDIMSATIYTPIYISYYIENPIQIITENTYRTNGRLRFAKESVYRSSQRTRIERMED